MAGSFDVDMFNAFMGEFMNENSANIFRSKGVLSFEGQEKKWVFQVCVHMCAVQHRLLLLVGSCSPSLAHHPKPTAGGGRARHKKIQQYTAGDSWKLEKLIAPLPTRATMPPYLGRSNTQRRWAGVRTTESNPVWLSSRLSCS